MQEPTKDNSGEKIYVRKKDYPDAVTKTVDEISDYANPLNNYDSVPENLDEFLLDTHGHLMVKHDLFNHDGLTKNGIAEAFIEFAKKEKLSFF